MIYKHLSLKKTSSFSKYLGPQGSREDSQQSRENIQSVNYRVPNFSRLLCGKLAFSLSFFILFSLFIDSETQRPASAT
jgi:hypothetical protein